MMNDNVKQPVLIVALVLFSGVLFAQEPLIFVAVEDNVAYSSRRTSEIEIRVGDRINANRIIFANQPMSEEYHLLISFEDSGAIYTALAKHFHPAYTQDLFGEDIFIDYPPDRLDSQVRQIFLTPLSIGDVDKMWVPDYYVNVLLSGSRYTLLEFHPGVKAFDDTSHSDWFPWYENTQAGIQNGRAMFYDAAIALGIRTNFLVRNIKRTDFGYVVDVVESTWNRRDRWITFNNSAFWEKYSPGDAMTLFLLLDGDYLDIYVNGTDLLLGTFVRVGREFIAQYQSLIQTNTADLTNVIWPSRADGRQYRLPVDISGYLEALTAPEEEPANTMLEQEQGSNSNTVLFIVLSVAGLLLVGIIMLILKKRKRFKNMEKKA